MKEEERDIIDDAIARIPGRTVTLSAEADYSPPRTFPAIDIEDITLICKIPQAAAQPHAKDYFMIDIETYHSHAATAYAYKSQYAQKEATEHFDYLERVKNAASARKFPISKRILHATF